MTPGASEVERPPFGSGIRVGDLRSQLERLVGGVPLLPPGVAWRIVPSIGVDVGKFNFKAST